MPQSKRDIAIILAKKNPKFKRPTRTTNQERREEMKDEKFLKMPEKNVNFITEQKRLRKQKEIQELAEKIRSPDFKTITMEEHSKRVPELRDQLNKAIFKFKEMDKQT